MDPIVGGALIGGAASIGSSFLNNAASTDAAEEAGKQAKELWQMQANWNTPANQVKRLRDAGLNPNLIYGNGSANTGNMSHAPELVPPAAKQWNFDGVVNALNNYIELKNKAESMQLEKVKTLSAIEHSRDALELERRRMLIDEAFKTKNYDLSSKRYGLDRERFDFEKGYTEAHGVRPGTTLGYLDRLIGSVIGKSPTDVGTDTNRMLNGLFDLAFRPVSRTLSGYNASKSLARKFMNGFKGVRY